MNRLHADEEEESDAGRRANEDRTKPSSLKEGIGTPIR